MSEVGIQELFKVLLDIVREFSRLNANMEKVQQTLEQVEDNESKLITTDYETRQKIEDACASMKKQEENTFAVKEFIREQHEKIREDIDKIEIPKDISGLNPDRMRNLLEEFVDDRLLKENRKWLKRLFWVAVGLLIIIFTMIGLDFAGVINIVKTAIG